MLLVGHLCWAYVTARTSASALGISVNPYLVMLLGILPDIDFLLSGFDVAHRTITHSLLFWLVVFIPLFVKYKRRIIPYFLAVSQHILIGDFIVSGINPFWPFNAFIVGLHLNPMSPENVILETAGLSIFLIWSLKNGHSKEFFRVKRANLLSIVVLSPLIIFILILLYQSNNIFLDSLEGNDNTRQLARLTRLIGESDLVPWVIMLHVILAFFLLMALIQGFRALSRVKSRIGI